MFRIVCVGFLTFSFKAGVTVHFRPSGFEGKYKLFPAAHTDDFCRVFSCVTFFLFTGKINVVVELNRFTTINFPSTGGDSFSFLIVFKAHVRRKDEQPL